MVIDLYSQRQTILQNTSSWKEKVYRSFVGQQVLWAREVMQGIDATTALRPDGTKLKNTKYNKTQIILSHQRHLLTLKTVSS